MQCHSCFLAEEEIAGWFTLILLLVSCGLYMSCVAGCYADSFLTSRMNNSDDCECCQ